LIEFPDNASDASSPSPLGKLPHLPPEPLQAFGVDTDLRGRFMVREPKPKILRVSWLDYAALRFVDFQLELPADETGDAFLYSVARAFAFDIDDTVIGKAHELQPASQEAADQFKDPLIADT